MTFTHRSAAGDAATETSTTAAPRALVPAPSLSAVSVSMGTPLKQYAVMMAQAPASGGIDPNWILFDSQSTISVFRNASMLRFEQVTKHPKRPASPPRHHKWNPPGLEHDRRLPKSWPRVVQRGLDCEHAVAVRVPKGVHIHDGHIQGTCHQYSPQGRNHNEFCGAPLGPLHLPW